jgi:hypothetical protein
MSATTPRVWGHYLEDPQQPGVRIELDTAAWVAWLNAPSTRRFSYPLFDAQVGYIVGFMTVRKEHRQRGGAYWSVYRRAQGRLQKIYLGTAAAVTTARLEELAATLRTMN